MRRICFALLAGFLCLPSLMADEGTMDPEPGPSPIETFLDENLGDPDPDPSPSPIDQDENLGGDPDPMPSPVEDDKLQALRNRIDELEMELCMRSQVLYDREMQFADEMAETKRLALVAVSIREWIELAKNRPDLADWIPQLDQTGAAEDAIDYVAKDLSGDLIITRKQITSAEGFLAAARNFADAGQAPEAEKELLSVQNCMEAAQRIADVMEGNHPTLTRNLDFLRGRVQTFEMLTAMN